MTHSEHLAQLERQEVQRLRMLMVAGGLLYLAWGMFYNLILSNPKDPIHIRLSLTTLFLLVAWAFGGSRAPLRKFSKMFNTCCWIMTAHFFWILQMNDLLPLYASGVSILVLVTVLVSPTFRSGLAYSLFTGTLSLALGLSVHATHDAILFLELGVFTSLIIGLIIHHNRLSMLKKAYDSEKLYWSMVENLAEGVVLQDRNGILHSSNHNAHALLGLSKDQMEGRTSVDPSWKCIRETGEPWPGETHPATIALKTGVAQIGKVMGVYRPDASLAWISINARPLFQDGESTPSEVLVSFRDITEQKNAEEALREQQALIAASTRMSALGEMAAGIAHEINNPLAIISGRVSQILRHLELGKFEPEKIKHLSQNIESTTQRISKIINGLRAFAREGSHDPFVAVPISQIIEDTLVLCRERFNRYQVNLQVDPIDENLTIECRSGQIAQVLLNFLQNSFDAIENQDEKWIRIGAENRGSDVVVFVEDNGPGVPIELRQKVLQPFFTTKEIGRGTGLGLSISMGILKSHRGDLILGPPHGRTRFEAHIPKRQNESAHAA